MLGRELGGPVQLETDKDFSSFMNRVRADLAPDVAARILDTLLGLPGLPGGRDALSRIGADRFEPAEDREYEFLGAFLGQYR